MDGRNGAALPHQGLYLRTTSATNLLVIQLKTLDLPQPVFEHRFHPVRRFRFDLAFEAQKVAIEIDGATFAAGRHVRGAGHLSDAVKRNLATELGWRVLTYVPRQIESGEAIQQIARVLNTKRSTFPRAG